MTRPKIKSRLTEDEIGRHIQAFSPNPVFCHAAVTIEVAAILDVENDTENVGIIQFYSTGDVDVYFNSDTTFLMTHPSNTIHQLILNDNITSVHFVNNGASSITFQRWGM